MKYVAVMMVSACISPVMHFGAGKSAHEAQHDRLAELLPPQLDMQPAWHDSTRTARIRVWADDDFRAQNIHWEQVFGEQLDYANAVLEPVLGLHLIADYHAWDFRAPPGSTLSDDLHALEQRDPGDDVLAVIGLTSSLSLVTASFEQLGLANMPGRHAVLRGYADLEERAAFGRAFPDLSPDEREAALEARRRHKTTVTLLHELAHDLGADHEPTADTIMNATYSDHAAAFSEQARTVALATIDARLHPERAVLATAPPPTLPPPAPTLSPPRKHAELTVKLAPTGATAIDGTILTPAALDERLRDVAARDPSTELVIAAPRGTPRALIVKLMDRARAQGLSLIGMALEP
ncbi:MAG TPA: biopolymer transporter ExbD [Kofleriaceae bacterium]|nr:biopolymer transporter ExbD [Kofleriaceae bacterium]